MKNAIQPAGAEVVKMMRVSLLLGCALYAIPATAQILPPPPTNPQLDANGVDVQSGNFQYSQTDLSIGPPGINGLTYTRYNSNYAFRDNFSTALSSHSVDGQDIISVGNSSEVFVCTASCVGGGPRYGSSLDITNGIYTLKDGTKVDFDHYADTTGGSDEGDQIITTSFAGYIEYPNGVRLTFHYRDAIGGGFPNTRLQSVTSNTGFQMKFYYQNNTMTSDPATRGTWTTVTKIVAINNAQEYCDPDADTCSLLGAWREANYSGSSYQYSNDAAGNQTRYTIGPSFAVKSPASASDNISYVIATIADPCPGGQPCVAGPSRKVTQATIDGKQTNYAYTFNTSAMTSTVVATAPLSQQTTYVSPLGYPGVNSVKDALTRTVSFGYDTQRRLTSVTSPEGNYTKYILDDDATGAAYTTRGNITQATLNPKPGSGLASVSESWVFPACTGTTSKTCNQPTSYTDPRSNTTTYTYDPAHGGKLTETAPADPNGIHPVRRYAYAQRYAWIKNNVGGYVHAPTPIWLLTEERTCQASATVGNACSAGSSDEIVTAYDYGPDSGPNNLLLRAKLVTAGGVSLRTCYGYDIYGNKISETTPRGNCS